MSRRPSVRAVPLVLAVLLFTAGLAGCAPAIDPESQSSGTPATAVVIEDLFLAQTAAHLCEVQGTVYPDQESLAVAYESLPDYAEIPSAAVARLTERLRTDARFSRLLNEHIAEECG